jgi:hypothetical protein
VCGAPAPATKVAKSAQQRAERSRRNGLIRVRG